MDGIRRRRVKDGTKMKEGEKSDAEDKTRIYLRTSATNNSKQTSCRRAVPGNLALLCIAFAPPWPSFSPPQREQSVKSVLILELATEREMQPHHAGQPSTSETGHIHCQAPIDFIESPLPMKPHRCTSTQGLQVIAVASDLSGRWQLAAKLFPTQTRCSQVAAVRGALVSSMRRPLTQ